MGMLYELDPEIIAHADFFFSAVGIVVALWIVARWNPEVRRD